MKAVNEQWEEYRDAIYPDGLHAVQNKECHQAFVAGMLAASITIRQIGMLPDGLAENVLEAFLKDVVKQGGAICKP